jgi:hypothetical protein
LHAKEEYNPYKRFKQSKLFEEVKNAGNINSATLWYEWVQEYDLLSGFKTWKDKDENRGFEKEDLWESYTKRCKDTGVAHKCSENEFKNNKLKELGFELDQRMVRENGCMKTTRKRLAFLPAMKEESVVDL